MSLFHQVMYLNWWNTDALAELLNLEQQTYKRCIRSSPLPPCWKLFGKVDRGAVLETRASVNGTAHFGPTVRTGQCDPPQKVVLFSRKFSTRTGPFHLISDRNFRKMWVNGKRPLSRLPQLNRPFYSCGSVTRPMNGSEAAGDFVLIQSSLLFLCKCRLVSITTTQFT